MVVLYIIPLFIALMHILLKRDWRLHTIARILLAYILVLNIGALSLLAAFAHIFMGPETAAQIGWQPGSPFQYEVGVANLSYGVLGVLCYWFRDRFWTATVIGWSVFVLGAFVGHMIQKATTGNVAPYNYGFFVWYNDLFLPIFSVILLSILTHTRK